MAEGTLADAMDGALELRGVSHRAGGTTILDGVSVRFAPGRFNVIVGPNGAGKSTLMRVATGLLQPAAGGVRYAGRALGAYDAEGLARVRAVLSQHVELAFPLAVEDVVLMGRYPHYDSVPAPHDREIVTRALELVAMAHKRHQPYPTLSGGEQQKVQMARVLSQIWPYDPPPDAGSRHRWLFLDEPTSSLDVHYQIQLLDLARDLLRHGCTVIAVLHDLNVAFHYGDRVLMLDQGRVALETDEPRSIPAALIERVFRVKAHQVRDPEGGDSFWRFAL